MWVEYKVFELLVHVEFLYIKDSLIIRVIPMFCFFRILNDYYFVYIPSIAYTKFCIRNDHRIFMNLNIKETTLLA